MEFLIFTKAYLLTRFLRSHDEDLLAFQGTRQQLDLKKGNRRVESTKPEHKSIAACHIMDLGSSRPAPLAQDMFHAEDALLSAQVRAR